jgi:hypothetical protein
MHMCTNSDKYSDFKNCIHKDSVLLPGKLHLYFLLYFRCSPSVKERTSAANWFPFPTFFPIGTNVNPGITGSQVEHHSYFGHCSISAKVIGPAGRLSISCPMYPSGSTLCAIVRIRSKRSLCTKDWKIEQKQNFPKIRLLPDMNERGVCDGAAESCCWFLAPTRQKPHRHTHTHTHKTCGLQFVQFVGLQVASIPLFPPFSLLAGDAVVRCACVRQDWMNCSSSPSLNNERSRFTVAVLSPHVCVSARTNSCTRPSSHSARTTQP